MSLSPDELHRHRWANWSYSQAVAAGAYGDQAAHVRGLDSLDADQVEREPRPPTPGEPDGKGMVVITYPI